jgi:GTP-binding protein
MTSLPQTNPRKPKSLPWSSVQFLLAAHRLDQLPADSGTEVAFAGRSNAGKSSALNAITGQHKLARTSKTPGRTQQLVVFNVDDNKRLIDLPGYGYAEVPVALRAHWGKTLSHYFANRISLQGLLLIMDIRHPLRDYDRMMLDLCASQQRACHILLTKSDKLGRGQAGSSLQSTRKMLQADFGDIASIQLFSATSGAGIDEARSKITSWLRTPIPDPAL